MKERDIALPSTTADHGGDAGSADEGSERSAGDRRSRIAGGGDPDGSAGGAGVLPRGIARFDSLLATPPAARSVGGRTQRLPAARRPWTSRFYFVGNHEIWDARVERGLEELLRRCRRGLATRRALKPPWIA